jgi:hypothetical protein
MTPLRVTHRGQIYVVRSEAEAFALCLAIAALERLAA